MENRLIAGAQVNMKLLSDECREIACISAQLMLFCSYVKPTQNNVYLILSYLILSYGIVSV